MSGAMPREFMMRNETIKKCTAGAMLFGGTLGATSAAEAGLVVWNCNIAFGHVANNYGTYINVIGQQAQTTAAYTNATIPYALQLWGSSSTLAVNGNSSASTFLGSAAVKAPTGTSNGAASLAIGTVVGSAQAWATFGASINKTTIGYSWTNAAGNTNYFGFRMKNAGGATLYGWASVALNSGSFRNGTVTQIVYDDTGASVTVGVVPAPGALALLGVAGLVGSRRRR